MALLRCFFVLISVFLISSISQADVDSGYAWLSDQQQVDGGVYLPGDVATPFQSSAEAQIALLSSSIAAIDADLLKSYLFHSTIDTYSTEHLSLLVSSKFLDASNKSELMQSLSVRQNFDGGIGANIGYASTPLDTAWALQILGGFGERSSIAAKALAYLEGRQLSDGSWPVGSAGEASGVITTAAAIRAIWHYRHNYSNVQLMLDKSIDYLNGQRSSVVSTVELSELLLALLPNLDTNDAVSTQVSALIAAQNIDGSWNADSYITAKALQALAALDAPNPDLLKISGRLVDGDSKLPMSGVPVVMTGSDSNTITTDSNGEFEFSKLKQGFYALSIETDGYGSLSWNSQLAAGVSRQLGDIYLLRDLGGTSSSGSSSGGTTPTKAQILGQVINGDTGQPLTGVTISVEGQNKTALTDADGRYQITAIEPGSIRLQAQKAGFNSVAAEVALLAGQRALFSPLLGSKPPLNTTVSGLISTEAGDVSGALVVLTGANEQQRVLDTSGAFNIEQLHAGATDVNISLPGYHSITANIDVAEGINYEIVQQLVVIDLPPPVVTASLRGRLIAADTQQPLAADISVIIDGVNKSVQTGTDGRFEFSDLPSGDAILQATAAGYKNIALQLSTVAGSNLDLGVLELLLSDVDALYHYQGSVLNSQTNQPLAGATVLATTVAGSYAAIADANGVFNLTDVDSAQIELSFAADGYTGSQFLAIGSAHETLDLGQIRLRPEGLDSYLPDLIVTKVNNKAVLNDEVTLTVSGKVIATIENNSVAGVSRPIDVTAFVDSNSDGSFDPSVDQPMGRAVIPSLAASERTDIAVDVQGVLPYRDAPISVELDVDQVLVEANESNNVGRYSCQKNCQLFSDDFNVGRSIEWRDTVNQFGSSANWSVVDGVLMAPAEGGASIVDDNSWENYTLEVDVYFPQGATNDAGLLFRHQDEENGYQFRMRDGEIRIISSVDGLIDPALLTKPVTVVSEQWYRLKVEVAGSLVKAYLDSELIFEFSGLELASGKAGLLDDGVAVHYDNFSVKNCTGTLNPKVKWHWGHANSSSYSNTQVMSSPVVAQLSDDNADGIINSDDVPDILFSAFSGRSYLSPAKLIAVSGDDGSQLWSNSENKVSAVVGPAVADIDGDGLVEIISAAGAYGGAHSLVVFEHDGTLKWEVPIERFGTPSVADLNNDGAAELIVNDAVYDHNGNLQWQGIRPDSFSIAVDLDLDSTLEVFAGGIAYSADGQVLWRAAMSSSKAGVGNFDNDDYPELASIVNKQSLVLLEHDGSVKWGPVAIPGGGGGAVTIADMDADGEPEIGVAGRSYYVVFETDGSVKWLSPTQDHSSRVTGSSVFDFDGDGKAEVLYNDEVKFRAYDGSTGAVLYELANPSGTLYEYPVIADVDNDGHAEIVLASNNYAFPGVTGIRVLESVNDDWMPTRSIWNQHSYHITNINDDGTVPQFEQPSWLTHNSYRLNTFVDRNASDQFDLTLSKLTLVDHGVGSPMSLSARIGNAGVIASGNSLVEFYSGSVSSSTKLGELTFASLGVNQYRDITLEGLSGIADGDTLIAIVNRHESAAECDGNNNQQNILASAIVGKIDLQFSQSAYLQGENATVIAAVINTGLFTSDYELSWQLLDAEGLLVSELMPQTITALASNENYPLSLLHPLESLQAGDYRVTAKLSSLSGVLLDQAVANFKILATGVDGSEAAVSLSLATDKPVYRGFDQVELSARAFNAALNHQLAAAHAQLSVLDSSGAEIFRHNFAAQTIAPNSWRDLLSELKLVNAESGRYWASITLLDQESSELLAEAHAQFDVVADSLQSISGTSTVTSTMVEAGESLLCEHKAFYQGNLAADIELQYLLLNVADQQTLKSETQLHHFEEGGNRSHGVSVDTAPLTSGHYLCLQQAKVEGNTLTLSHVGFDVVSSSSKLSANLSLGAQPRLLVLVDSLPADLNSELFLSEQAEREALQQTLDSAGWFYTLVDSEADFIREVNEGGYSVYALLAERVMLSTDVQSDLNQRVAAGDGLLLAQGSEFLYPELQSSLGVEVHDYDLAANQLDKLQGSVFAEQGDVNFSTEQQLLNFTLGFNGELTAELAARFSDVNTSGALGVSPFGVGGAYNALVFGDFTAPSSTVEGRLGVAGNLDIDGYSIGDKLDGTMLTDTLVVGGDIHFPTGRVYNGSLLAGGSVAGVGSNVFDGMEPGTSIHGNLAKQLPIGFEQSRDFLSDLSTSLGMLTANGETKVEWGGYYLTGDSVGAVQVFDVDADTLANVHSFVVRGIPVDATVIFNIHGSYADVSNISFEDMKDHSFTTIYNFPQATSIHFNGVKMRGSVLAPLADINVPNGDIFGQLIAARWNGVMSISLFGFRGDIGDALTQMQLENAAAFNQEELGKAMFNGFDLARNLATHPNAFGDWLLQSLDAVAPNVSLTAGKVVPIKLTIFNERAATQGKAEITLPAEITLIYGELLSEGAHWRYDFDLLEAETSTTEFYIRLPYSAVNGEVSLELFSGITPNLLPQGNHLWPLVVEPPVQIDP